jgi:threonylcarbamoyladenosine tRNA methylthiotransferase MtaB
VSQQVLGVAFKTLGCKVNQVESEAIATNLIGRGARVVDETSAAVVVVNTCTVTGEADAKARKEVRRALNAPNAPIVVVTGCMAALSRESLQALGERVVVEPNKELVSQRVAEVLGAGLSAGAPGGVSDSERGRWGKEFHTRAMLKIGDGCDAFCSYCIVPYARGAPRPVTLETIRSEAADLVERGAREIVLTGVNLGRYNERGRDLADVVVAVAGTGVDRLRLSSVEPLDLTDRLLETLAALPSVCPHLHVPLQSGSDAVLERMARRYTSDEYDQAIARARAALPSLAITTDVIAGFPGETDEEAAASLGFCRRLGFAKLHVFRYSERAGSPAASMPGRVEPKVRADRAAALRALDSELQRRFAGAHKDEVVEVLVEQVEAPARGTRAEPGAVATGTSRDYLKVAVETEGEVAVGDAILARVVDTSGYPVRARTRASDSSA